jgi:hypothetical protein
MTKKSVQGAINIVIGIACVILSLYGDWLDAQMGAPTDIWNVVFFFVGLGLIFYGSAMMKKARRIQPTS